MNYVNENNLVEEWHTSDISDDRHLLDVRLTIDYDKDYIGTANVTVLDLWGEPQIRLHYALSEITALNLNDAIKILTDYVNDKLVVFFDHEI